MAVADPAACRHMSPTSLAYAALAQEFIRGTSKLPVWDKSKARARVARAVVLLVAFTLWALSHAPTSLPAVLLQRRRCPRR